MPNLNLQEMCKVVSHCFFRGLVHVSSTLDLGLSMIQRLRLWNPQMSFLFFSIDDFELWGYLLAHPSHWVPNPVISRVSGINRVIAVVTHVRTGVNY